MLIKSHRNSVHGLVLFLVIVISFTYPLSASLIGFCNIDSTPVNIGIRTLLVVISMSIIGLSFFRKSSFRFNFGTLSLIAFWVVYSLRLIYDVGIRDIYFYGVKGPEYVFPYAFGNGLIPIIAVSLSAKFVKVGKINNWLILCLALSNLAILLFLVSGGLSIESIASRVSIQNDDQGDILNSISLARYGGALSVVSFTMLFFFRNSSFKNVTLFVLAILGFSNLVIGASKGPFIFFVFIFIILLLLYLIKSKYNVIFNMRLGFALVLVVIGYFNYIRPLLSNYSIGIFKRLAQLGGDSESYRTNKLYGAFDQFWENPVFGDQYLDISLGYPHNILVESLMATGILGTIFLMSSFIYLLVKFLSIYRDPTYYPFYFVTIFTLLCYMTSNNLFEGADLWALLAFVIALRIRPIF